MDKQQVEKMDKDMTAMVMFGRTSDGVLSKCTAKPENRGKGNCPHSAHFELPADKAEQILQKDAERQLEKQYNKLALLKKRDEKRERKEKAKTAEMERFQKFINAKKTEIDDLTEHYSSEDLRYIDTFIDDLKKLSTDNRKENALYESIVEKHLMSNSCSASKVRAKFGNDYSVSDISKLLVRTPSSMTKKLKSKNGNHSSSRIILSSIANNMNRENYIKSVIYFGGKCCYCGTTLKTEDGENCQKATGEHLTPLSPDNKDAVRSSTRFGNMALCCENCNRSRRNEDLEPWIVKTSRVKRNRKVHVISKIRAFREFAEYKEFNKEFSQEIDKSLEYLSREKETMSSEESSEGLFKKIMNDEIEKLRDFPNKYES